jgi:putative DNA primase/helicase
MIPPAPVPVNQIPVPPPPPVTTSGVPAEVAVAAFMGKKVFPVAAGTKIPLVKWGSSDRASSDLNQLEKWFIRYGATNWGLATGERSELFVLDSDCKAGYEWVVSKGLSSTYTVKTGGGTLEKQLYGYHFYFKQPAGLRVKNSTAGNKFSLAPGVDVRGDGGYVLMPPSVTDNPYFAVNDAEIAEAPEWLLALVEDKTPERAAVALGDLEPLTDDQRRLGENIFNKRCREYAEVQDGSWNTELTRLTFLAGRMVARGVFTREDAEARMLEIPTVATYMVEERRTVEKNFASGFEKGIESPWDPEEIEERKIAEAGFGQSPLPAGASLTPPPQSYLPASELAAMVAIAAENPNKGEAISLMMQVGTQDSIAAAFATAYADNLRFDHARNKWYIWDGTRWRADDKKEVFDLAVRFCRQNNPQGKSNIGSAGFARAVEDIASARQNIRLAGTEWDRENYLLNTPAGTVDLRTGLMGAHDPTNLVTKCAAAAPGTVSDGAAFRKFMLEITEGDEELVRFHQVSLGACLSGAIEDHWLLFWVGEGRNGKNTLGDLVEEALGDYARTIRTSTLMSKTHQSHPEELANLQGIRMAISSEVNDGDHWDESRIKQVTGDATISARHMYGSSFTYLRTHKHLVYGNHRPQLRSTDSAIKSRIKIVPFKVSFRGREDKDLPRRLREEMGFVLQWMIQGHQQWLEAGKKLPKCAAVDAESADYFASQSTPEMWLEECTEIVDPLLQPINNQCPRSGDLYRSYSEWKKNRGEPALTQTRWAETMKKRFQKVRGLSGHHYKGLRILPPRFGFPVPPPPPGVAQ